MDFRNHRLRALITELYLLSELEYFDLLTSVQEYRAPFAVSDFPIYLDN